MEEKGNVLSGEYVKNYYDTQVGKMSSYEGERWHSSPVREFEYKQTKRALKQALGRRTYANAIEIGPGDAVWTPLLRKRVTGNIHLIEQSEEMLKRAKEKTSGLQHITFERSDFMTSHPPNSAELITAIRCFEYFGDKLGALKKMRVHLARGGSLVIITKNAELLTGTSVQGRRIHSDQLTRKKMYRLAKEAGLEIDAVYPAVLRFKAAWPPMRFIFNLLHHIATVSRGRVVLPVLSNYATESYVYVMHAQ